MKKVKATIILVAIRLVMILNEMFRTVRSLKVANPIDDERNTTPMLALKDESLINKIFSGFKIVRLANDRSGKKRFGFISFWESLVYSQDENGNGKMLILPTLPNPNASVIAVLNLSGNHDADVILMKDIRTKCTGNSYVSIVIGTLTALDTLIAAYENAHGPARAVTLVPLVEALDAIMALFQTCANLPANKSNSIVIIQSGGFHVKGKGGAHDRIFEASYGVNSGEIELTCPTNDKACYEWWYSPDNIIWTRMQGSTVSETTISGLPPGKMAYFKYQHIIGNTGQGISAPIQKMVV